jgi:anti-repressor protein
MTHPNTLVPFDLDGNPVREFMFGGRPVRVIIRDGEPFWIAKDVCDALGINNSRMAISRLDADEKNTVSLTDGIRESRGNPNFIVVSESGLYALVMGSRKREAKAFTRWVTHEVLPAIRKHGAYLTPAAAHALIESPKSEAARLASIFARNRELECQVDILAAENAGLIKDKEENAPRVEYTRAIEKSNTSCLIGELAKIFRQAGYDIGQNRLFDWLRQTGWLMSGGSRHNMPSQKALDRGVLSFTKRVIHCPDGSVRETRTPLVTGKGQIFFLDLYRRYVLDTTFTTGSAGLPAGGIPYAV